MIKVHITSGFIADELAIAGLSEAQGYMKTEGKLPGEVFDAMIALGIDWEIQYDEATAAETNEWALADVVCRQVRARKMGKTLLLEGVPVGYDEFQEQMIGFVEKNGFLPEVISDNAQSLILGINESEEEDLPGEEAEK